MTTLLARALDLLYPPRCPGCGVFGEALCDACADGLTPAHGLGRCHACGARWIGESRCPACANWRTLDGVRAAFDMEGVARRLVHDLKYRGVRVLAAPMAEAISPLLEALDPDVIHPIPLHPRRRRSRGFNQAEALFDGLGWPPAHGRLERVRATASQVGLSAGERRENVAGAFRYRGPGLKGATVAVLDDVVTSGATAAECARVLREHGAARVYALAYARAAYRSPASGGDTEDGDGD